MTWGGRTDLDNLIPLCWGCHGKIHDHDWQVVRADDGKHTIRPPDRIHHGPARLPDTAPLFALANPPHRVEPEPRVAPDSNDALSGQSSNGSRAGPTGPQAARAALRKARTTPRRVPAAGA